MNFLLVKEYFLFLGVIFSDYISFLVIWVCLEVKGKLFSVNLKLIEVVRENELKLLYFSLSWVNSTLKILLSSFWVYARLSLFLNKFWFLVLGLNKLFFWILIKSSFSCVDFLVLIIIIIIIVFNVIVYYSCWILLLW